MKIFFDHQIFSLQMYGGISRYFANLSYAVNTQNEFETKVGVVFTDNAYLNNRELLASALNTVVKRQKKRFKYNSWYCKYLLMQNYFDVFHPTYYYPYFLSSLKKPFVLTVHDMINELFPQYFATDPITKYKAILINRADHIIAISESTKNDIQKFFDVDEKKISVIHLANHVNINPGSPGMLLTNEEYILFVGDRFGYKNFDPFLKAAAPVILKHPIKLICAGGGRFRPDEVKLIHELKIHNCIQQVSVNDNDLAHLYKNATAFVYPSLYEGFGLPVLEAFANNCPLIVSNTSSLPEVAGGAAEYFNPAEKESITFAIEKVVNNKTLQQELRVKGAERGKLFSFENCVQQTSQVYSSLT